MTFDAFLPVANHLWQSTLFAGAAGLLTLAYRRNHAGVRYSLWLAASLKFLVPFSLIVVAASRFATPGAPAITRFPLLPVIDEIGEPFAASAPAVPASGVPSPNYFPVLLLATWMTGVGVNVFAWSKQWLYVRKALRGARPLQYDAPIPVFATTANLEPGVFGLRRPVLLLPGSIMQHLTGEQLDAVVVHELCHVRRRDNIAAAIHMVVEAVFWFHPLVWWIGLRLMEERERACDEEVLSRGGDPEAYAEGLLNVCKLYVESPLACAAGVTGSDLKRRIENIMTHRVASRLTMARKALLAGALITAGALPVVIGIAHPSALRAQDVSKGGGKFEVASIKENKEPARSTPIGWNTSPGGRFHASSLPVFMLIAAAYDIPFQSARLTGGPDWIGEVRYDIDAEPEKGAIPASVGPVKLKPATVDENDCSWAARLWTSEFALCCKRF